ncbi:hypothetical protein STRDD11_02061 [Streptococcus sp. DD11]|nr:hypothetical protein STRDD11_02061 [Streptococcus sp. DD11]
MMVQYSIIKRNRSICFLFLVQAFLIHIGIQLMIGPIA